MRWWLSVPLAILCYVGVEQLVERVTLGFWIERVVASDLVYNPAFDASCPTPHIEEVLQQPFHLIGKGSECFAFVSADQAYVIKLFKLDTFRPVYLRSCLFGEDYSAYAGTVAAPRPLLKRLCGIREFRIQRTFLSNLLAHRLLTQETAVVYLHLNPSTSFSHPLTLYDGNGIVHTLDPNAVRFVIQKRAIPLLAHFQHLIDAQQVDAAKESIDSLIDLLKNRCLKGISDRDIVCRNFGFVGNKAIEMDTGSFAPFPEMKARWLYTQEVYYATLDLKSFLKKRAPDLALYLQNEVDKRIS